MVFFSNRTKHLGAEFIIFGRETRAFQQIAPMHVACSGRAWLSHYTSLHENPAKASGEDTTSKVPEMMLWKSRKKSSTSNATLLLYPYVFFYKSHKKWLFHHVPSSLFVEVHLFQALFKQPPFPAGQVT